jgi:hypothetical protein
VEALRLLLLAFGVPVGGGCLLILMSRLEERLLGPAQPPDPSLVPSRSPITEGEAPKPLAPDETRMELLLSLAQTEVADQEGPGPAMRVMEPSGRPATRTIDVVVRMSG